jgi:hypothetical protein
MRILLTLFFISITSLGICETKEYYDSVKNIQVSDVSGIKKLDDLKKEFNAPNLIEITDTLKENIELAKREALEQSKVDSLIDEELRTQAIKSLQKIGKLDEEGKIIER